MSPLSLHLPCGLAGLSEDGQDEPKASVGVLSSQAGASNKEEGADKTTDMLVLWMKSLIRIKEDLVKEPSVFAWQGSSIFRHCFLVLLRARVSRFCMMDAIPGKDFCATESEGLSEA